MNRRDIAFLLIGLGIGLELAVVELYALLSSHFHVHVQWGQNTVLDGPLLLLMLGATMLWRDWSAKSKRVERAAILS